eukprot:2618693-Ditylum_brightwellii.AAC.1
MEEEEAFVAKKKDAKYEVITSEEVAQAQTHLTPIHRQVLQKVLERMPALYDGKLGLYPHRK